MRLCIRALFITVLALLLPALAVQAADNGRHCRMETVPMVTAHAAVAHSGKYVNAVQGDTGCDMILTEPDMLEDCWQLPDCVASGVVFDSVPQPSFPDIASQDVTVLPDILSASNSPETFWRPPRRA